MRLHRKNGPTLAGKAPDAVVIISRIKRSANLYELRTFKGKGPERAAGLSLWLYSVVWLWYLGQKANDRFTSFTLEIVGRPRRALLTR